MKLRLSLIIAVILLLLAGGLFYVNKVLLPIQIKGMAVKAASEAMKRSVTFDTLQYSPLQGFVVTNLVIAEKDDPARAFVRAMPNTPAAIGRGVTAAFASSEVTAAQRRWTERLLGAD